MSLIDNIHETIIAALAGDVQSIFLLGCVYVLLACAYSVVYQVRVSRWPAARGQLLKAGLRKFGVTKWVKAEQEYVADALYEYEVNGNKYVGKRLSPWSMVVSHNARFVLDAQLGRVKKGVDGQITVYYNPRNPKKSFLLRTGIVSQLITLAIGLVPAVVYFYKYHT